MIVKTGDIIRAYDFKPMAGRDDCYVEGVVDVVECNAMGYRAYKITCTKDHFGDEVSTKPSADCRVDHAIYVPHQVSFSEYPGRVINLSRL